MKNQVFSKSLGLVVTIILSLLVFGSGCTEAATVDASSEVCTDHDHDHEQAEDAHAQHDDQDHDEHVEIEDDHAEHNHAPQSVEEEDPHAGHDHGEGEESQDDAVIELSQTDMRDAGIEISIAGPGEIRKSFTHYGEIALNQERLAHMAPSVSGVVRSVSAELGDVVEEGELVALIASSELADAKAAYINASTGLDLAEEIFHSQQQLFENGFLSEQGYLAERQTLSEAQAEFNSARQALLALGISSYQLSNISSDSGDLTRFEVRAPISGTIIELHMTSGESVGPDSDLLVVADLSRVWVSLNVPQNSLSGILPGQEMTVSHSHGDILNGATTIDYVSPVVDHQTRTVTVRGELDNSSGLWRPGLFVSAEIESGASHVPVVVNSDAVQFLQGENVVFIPKDNGFVSVPVSLGASDGELVEIVEGLHPGDSYVSEGAFSLKAEIVTSGLDSHAGHGH